jgi:hypothetical protein
VPAQQAGAAGVLLLAASAAAVVPVPLEELQPLAAWLEGRSWAAGQRDPVWAVSAPEGRCWAARLPPGDWAAQPPGRQWS